MRWRQTLEQAVGWLAELGLSLDDRLERQKAIYISAKAEIEKLREDIAARDCPLSVGQRVTVVEGTKSFDLQIEYVHGAPAPEEFLGPVLGAKSGWTAGGHRFKATTGELSKSWSCSIVGHAFTFEDGAWRAPDRSLESFFNLPPAP
ncbi:MAG: hypothetical protein K2X07_10780 [Caulobacteraceae bacterium]|nr:hypothetical protein [Caulobacteraceae bacterium]